MAHLGISLLGAFQVALDGSLLTVFDSNKVRGLLAYLAVEADRPHTREALSALLWPDYPQEAALNSLRNTLAGLRRAIHDREAEPSYLLITRENIQFNRESDVWVDVAKFEQLALSPTPGGAGSPTNTDCFPSGGNPAKPGNRSSALGRNQHSAVSSQRLAFSPTEFERHSLSILDSQKLEIENRQSAIALYRGPFLDGFSLPDSAPFEEWLTLRREGLGQQAVQILRHLADSHEACGEYEQALAYAQRQVALEPWLEEGHRQVMRILALSGQRSEALAQYETCKRLLSSELGLEPAEETIHLHETIRLDRLEDIRPGQILPSPGMAPYKGLQYFSEADIALFFGRETLVGQLVERVKDMVGRGHELESANPPLLAVVGASGSGKSSLVRAGLVPAMRCLGWEVEVITPGAHPLEAALTPHPCPSPEGRGAGVRKEAKSLPLLILDQFEELFTLCREETERAAFVERLLSTRHPGGCLPVVLVLRADFYAHCAQYPSLRQALSARQEYIGPMSAAELRRAIEEPARRNGWQLEAGLVDLILRDIGTGAQGSQEPGALPLLEHALLETWKRRSGRTLTLAGYAAAGGVHGAIAQTAESLYRSLSPEQRNLARRIFLRLTELGEGTQDTRRRAALDELAHDGADKEMVNGLLKTLADARLITLAEGTAEVAHEALIREWPALRGWLSEDRESLRLHRHLTETAQAWDRLGRDLGELYRGARLAQATEWAQSHAGDLNALEAGFLQASQEQADREAAEREAQRQKELEAARRDADMSRRLARAQRQRRITLWAGTALAVILLGAALWFLRISLVNAAATKAERLRASQSRNELSRRLAAQSDAQKENDQELAMLLALEADYVANTGESQSSLLSGFQMTPRLWSIMECDSGINSLVISLDGNLLAAADNLGIILLWDISKPDAPVRLARLDADSGNYIGLAFSPDGSLLASGDDKGKTLLWDISKPDSPIDLARLDLGLTGYPSVAFSPDGTTLVSAVGGEFRTGGTVALFDMTDPSDPVRLSQSIAEDTDGVISLAFSADGEQLAFGSYGDTISLWDVTHPDAPVHLSAWSASHDGEVSVLAFSLDGRRLASASFDNSTILQWDISDPFAPDRVGPKVTGLTERISNLAISLDASRLGFTRDTNFISLWDLSYPDAPERLADLVAMRSMKLFSLAFSKDGKILASGGCHTNVDTDSCQPGLVLLWDFSGMPAPVLLARQLHGHSGHVASLAFSPDGEWLISGGKDDSVIQWDLASSVGPIPAHQSSSIGNGDVSSMAFDPGGKYLAIAGRDHSIRLWEINGPAATVQLGQSLTGDTYAESLAFTPDSRLLASGSRDKTISLWDVSNPTALVRLGQPMPGHEWYISCLAFSPDGNILASGSLDKTIILWDVSNPYAPLRLGKPFFTNARPVTSLAFSPDGKILAVGGNDYPEYYSGAISLLDVSDPTSPVQIGQPFTGHMRGVTTIAFSPDGKRLASGSSDPNVIIWDISDPDTPVRLGRPFTGYTGQVTSLVFSPDGKRLASGSKDQNVILWDISLDSWKELACRFARRNLTEAEWRQYLPGETYHKTCKQWK